jgi:hypothetical protein
LPGARSIRRRTLAAATSGGCAEESAVSAARRVRDYGQSLRVFANARLSEAEEDVQFTAWWGLLVCTLASAVVLVGAIRLLQAWTLSRGNSLVGWLGFVPGAVLAFGLLFLLLRVFWQIRLDPGQVRPYVVASLVSSIAIAVCTEAFAGMTTLLWDAGVVDARAGVAAALWPAERHYLWQLANGIPLLGATDTVGWKDPDLFRDAWSGGLLLAFKVLLILPLVQIAVVGDHVSS